MPLPSLRRRTRGAPGALAPRIALAIVVLSTGSCSSGAPAPLAGPVPEGRAKKEVSRRLCHQLRKCRCGEIAGVSLSNCDAGLGFAWEGSVERAAEEGWSYDGECLMRRLNALLERGCETASRVTPGCAEENCQIFHGTVPEGGACEGGPSASNCEQGLVCLGTCQKPCSGPSAGPLAEGERCMDEGELLGTCEEDSICHPDSGECVARPASGQPCIHGQCAQMLWCDPSSGEPTCRDRRPEGEECTTDLQCETLACRDATCAPVPSEGERCAGRCEGELVCARDETGAQVCVTAPTEGEACLPDPTHRCRQGLACADGVCVEPPGDGEACLDPASSPTMPCAGELVCGGKLCSHSPSAPGCDTCDRPEEECVVRVCMPEPPAVCSDLGGLLF